jgi:hypothetical protein
MGHAPVALDLARLLDEHATADLAATSKSLEEVNKLAHHRRLVLAIRRIEPLAHVDRAPPAPA